LAVVADPVNEPAVGKRHSSTKRFLLWGGLVGTTIYLIVLACRLHETGWDWLQTSNLNEFGDFLAGGFAPLAFLWLVIGYFQQNIELSISTESLGAQLDEMRHAVQQHRAQAEAMAQNAQLQKLSTVLSLYNQGIDYLAGCASSVVAAVVPINVRDTWSIYASGDREQWFRILVENRDLNEQAIIVTRHLGMGAHQHAGEQARNFIVGYERLREDLRTIGDDLGRREILERSYAGSLYRFLVRIRDETPNLIPR
jgi:hypothetical protein